MTEAKRTGIQTENTSRKRDRVGIIMMLIHFVFLVASIILVIRIVGIQLFYRPDPAYENAFTPKSIRTEEAMRTELCSIRERGWAMDDEEFEEDIISIAAPIMDRASSAAAAISVSWPSFRFSRAEARKHAGMIKAAAGSISGLLGIPS